MRTHIANAFYGVLDYVAWPAGMLAVAPIAVRALGIDRYGIWMVAGSAVSAGAIAASGFGDANIRYVAVERAAGNREALCRAVRSTLGIHLALGAALALAGLLLAPAMTQRLIADNPGLRADCLWSLRLACLLLLVRALESVCISTQRAFERYGAAVRISIAGRLLSLAAAAILPLLRPSVTSVLLATTAISIGSLWLQIAKLRELLSISFLWPRFDRQATRALLGFGKFTWMQAVSALLLGQVDRLVTGAALGAAAVSSYAMCVQLSQPIYGITAAGLHFLFPRITTQYARHDATALRRTVLTAIAANWAAVAVGTSVLLFFGVAILRAWGGPAIAATGAAILPIVLCSTALCALSVAGAYAMLAIGRVRMVAWLNLAAAAATIAAVLWLLPRYGIRGMAMARMAYGPITLGVYAPLFVQLLRRRMWPSAPQSPFAARDNRTPVNVLGIHVDPLDLQGALARIDEFLARREKGYVCAVSVHGVLEAQRDPRVARAFADAAMVVPDGRPIVWVGRTEGQRAIRQVTGPDLMRTIFAAPAFTGRSHFFYGGKEGVAQELAATWAQRSPGVRIVGTYTPPFRNLTAGEEAELIELLNRCRPDFIWVGISTPRQELFMRRLLPQLDTVLMFGVGAAFDFHTGRLRDCAPWIKRLGFQWLHRLLQDPRRLWRRNLHNATFLWHIALQLTGLRKYDLGPRSAGQAAHPASAVSSSSAAGSA